MPHKSDAEIVGTTHNIARFFTENRKVGLVVLVGIFLWGAYGYAHMPKRKDPEIRIRTAMAVCPWPGVSADQVEQLVTRKIEEKAAENEDLNKAGAGNKYGMTSLTLNGLSQVTIQLAANVADTRKVFSEIQVKLESINDLPQGAGPIQFVSDFGDTAAMMVTVASPSADEVSIVLQARAIAKAIDRVRAMVPAGQPGSRAAVVVAFPQSISPAIYARIRELIIRRLTDEGLVFDAVPIEGPGFVGFDAAVPVSDASVSTALNDIVARELALSTFDPDSWPAIVIRNPAETRARLSAVGGAKYTHRELDDFTELMKRTLETVAQVSKVQRRGVLPQQVELEYSQERLAS